LFDVASRAPRSQERSSRLRELVRYLNRFSVLRKKIVGVPLLLVVLTGATLLAINHYLWKQEGMVWEIGEGIRSRLDDFGADFPNSGGPAIAPYYTHDFRGSDFGFDRRSKVSEEGGILLEQWSARPQVKVDQQEFCNQLTRYRTQIHDAEAVRFKMVFLNSYSEYAANILLRFQVFARDEEGHKTEDRGHFNVDLVRQEGEWRIAKQELIEATRVTGIDSNYFTDVTKQVGIDFVHTANPLFKQRRYKFAVSDRSAGGVAAGDFDNDGYPDLFFTGGQGSKLYRNTGHGTFEDVTDRAGLGGEAGFYAQGAAWGDYNNDGCLDLYITRTPNVSNKLFRNNCDGTFTDVTKEAGVGLVSYSTTAAWADVDNDGYLDLYVATTGNALERTPGIPSHARDGEPDRLYHNNGNGTFTDITKEAGLGDTGWGIGVTFFDYDNDGFQDIYVANDFGPNTLWHNEGKGHFKMVARETGTLDYGFGMCAAAGDYNNDGYLDLYVSNLYSGSTWYLEHTSLQFIWGRFWAGGRGNDLRAAREIFENMGGSWKAMLALGRKFGEGNSLYENRGDGTFKSVGVEKHVNMTGWAWGSDFYDFDNDGDLDIHSVNGFISQTKGTDL
jgi:hypothetical protein